MDGKVLAITSGKGGVGKSTIVSNFGHFLAWKGFKTVILDLDIGLRTLDFILGIEEKDIKIDILQLLDNEKELEKSLIQIKENKKLYFIAASDEGDKESLDILKLGNLFKILKKEFDYIVIDSPAGIENGFEKSIQFADEIIITVTPDIFSIKDANKVINKIIDINEKIDVFLLINKFMPEFASQKDNFELNTIQQELGIPLIGVVEFDVKVIKSTNIGKPICLYKDTKAGEEIRNSVKRYLGTDIPLPKYSFLDKIKSFFFNKN